MKGFTIRYDTMLEKDFYNFKYYTDSEGNSANPIPINGFENLIDFLLTEIKERDAILDKLKTTKEISLGVSL
jgi:flagellar assembly factor FliW